MSQRAASRHPTPAAAAPASRRACARRIAAVRRSSGSGVMAAAQTSTGATAPVSLLAMAPIASANATQRVTGHWAVPRSQGPRAQDRGRPEEDQPDAGRPRTPAPTGRRYSRPPRRGPGEWRTTDPRSHAAGAATSGVPAGRPVAETRVPRDVDGVEQSGRPRPASTRARRQRGERPVQVPDIVPVRAREGRGEGWQVMNAPLLATMMTSSSAKPSRRAGQIAQDGDERRDQRPAG